MKLELYYCGAWRADCALYLDEKCICVSEDYIHLADVAPSLVGKTISEYRSYEVSDDFVKPWPEWSGLIPKEMISEE